MQSAKWADYFKITKGKGPHALLVKAVELKGEVGDALDLGAGALRDSVFLADKGYKVTALDSGDQLIEIASELRHPNIYPILKTYENMTLAPTSFDLINAQHSLPFIQPGHKEKFYEAILAALKPGGIFVGNFFGPNDDWAGGLKMTFESIDDASRIFSSLEIILLEEREEDGTEANGDKKHWHYIDFIVRK